MKPGDLQLTSEQELMLDVVEQHFVDRNNGDVDAIVDAHSEAATITLRESRWNIAWSGGVSEYVSWLAPCLGEGSGITWVLEDTMVSDSYVALTFLEDKATGTSLRWLAFVEFDPVSTKIVMTERLVTGEA